MPAAAQDMNLSQILLPGEGWQVAPMECKSAAGLAGDGRGNVYAADGKQIWRIDKGGKPSLFAKTDEAVHGLAVGPDGKGSLPPSRTRNACSCWLPPGS